MNQSYPFKPIIEDDDDTTSDQRILIQEAQTSESVVDLSPATRSPPTRATATSSPVRSPRTRKPQNHPRLSILLTPPLLATGSREASSRPSSPILAVLEEGYNSCLRAVLRQDALVAAVNRTSNLRISSKRLYYPESLPRSQGAYGDVWIGRLDEKLGETRIVAVKRIRLKPQDGGSNAGLLKSLLQEVIPWYDLSHRNITPFIGYTFDGNDAAMISEWQDNGHIFEYLAKHPRAKRLRMAFLEVEVVSDAEGEGAADSGQTRQLAPPGIPQDEIPLGAGGPPTAVPQIASQALPEGDYQQKGSRSRRSERRKEKNSKGKQKAEAVGDVGGGDDEIIEIDFNDMGQVFGPAPGVMSGSTLPITVPANPPPPQYPIQTQSQTTNRGGAPRGRGRGRGGRGGVQAANLPGQGGFLASVVNNSGYNHTDFDLQQYAYTAAGQSSSFQSSLRGGGPSSQPRYNQNAQPQSSRGGFGARRNGANFRGFAYDDDDNDPAGRALRNIARKGLTESNNMYLRPIKFVKSAAVLFQDQEEIFAAEVADNNNANSDGAAPTAERVEQVFHGGVKRGSGLAEKKEELGLDSESDSEDDSEDDSPKEGEKPVEAPAVEAAKAPLPRLEVATLVEATARLE
ncbi:hypothetical protein FRB90_002402, partial [Tulasnella sp. 427]